MKVQIKEIRKKMAQVLSAKKYSKQDMDFIIEMYLGGELRGHTSHGLASFPGFAEEDFSKLPKPRVIKSTHSLFMIDAKSNPGALVGKRAADEAIKRAKKEVVGTAIIKNMDSWLRPGAIAEYIADQGFLAIVTNDGGGNSIAPPGGYDLALGTNPIAYGIPTLGKSLVVDMATSKRAWGQVRLANKYGTHLPPDTFYNNKGQITLDPKEAYSVKSFGEYKGFALALLVEVMSGSLIGMNMAVDTKGVGSKFGGKLPDRGGFILVIDPGQTIGLKKFKKDNAALIKKIKSTRPLKGQKIRVPGEQAAKSQSAKIKSGSIDIPSELWQEIQSL